MEVLSTPASNRPQRSLSYNDLKKRRLQRSASNKKMTIPSQSPAQSKRRHLTEHKSLLNHIPKDEKTLEGVIYQLKGVLGDIRRKKTQKRFFSIKQSMTDRPSRQKGQETIKKSENLWRNVDQGGQTKQLIRFLLNKNKSQRKLMKFKEVRDRFKQQKQKSRSASKSKIIKEIVSPYKPKQIDSPEKEVNKSTKKLLSKKQVSTRDTPLDHSLQKLNSCPIQTRQKVWQEQLQNKQNQERVSFVMNITEISQIKSGNPAEDPSQSNPFIEEKTHQQGSFLRLLNKPDAIETKPASRQGRRKSEIDRIRKVFPQGFFAK